MKNFTIFILCLLFSGIVSAQSQFLVVGDISGVCDATTTSTSQEAGIGWDDCAGQVYEGTVEFEATSDDPNLYNVFTMASTVTAQFNDMSFGAFYACYGSDDQTSFPNTDASNPTLFFQVGENGVLGYTGTSQWGEVFSVADVIMAEDTLNFQWTNDYGEGAMVQLVRQDSQYWEQLLSIVSTQEISQIESISINPNPVSLGENILVNVDLNQSVDMNLQIIDITGKTVHNQSVNAAVGNNEINIDSQSLNSGMYFVKLSSENGVTTKKIAIQ
ncbi:MAG: hypothetical protein ACJA1A_000959 [Saprospiraceae bacterium]|jgi:hypothetical protein